MYNILNFTIMFFQAINQMITAGTGLSINIRRVNNNLTVAVVPRRSGVKDGERIVPLILNGTPEELDAGFLQAVGTPSSHQHSRTESAGHPYQPGNVREAGGTGGLTKQSRQVCGGERVQRGPRETGKDGKIA